MIINVSKTFLDNLLRDLAKMNCTIRFVKSHCYSINYQSYKKRIFTFLFLPQCFTTQFDNAFCMPCGGDNDVVGSWWFLGGRIALQIY